MKILWIEDNSIFLKGLFRPLKRQGAMISTVPTAEEGIQEFINTGPYDVVVVDLILPRSIELKLLAREDHNESYPGVKVLRRIRELDQHTPVVVLTVVGDERLRDIIHSLGAELMLKGLVLPQEFCAKIRSMVNRKTGLNS
jgi:DNA-binding response OmpR family regulator